MGVASVYRNFMVYSLGNALQRLSTVIMMPVYTFYLSPEQYGIFSLVTLAVGVLAGISISTSSGAINRFYVEHEGAARRAYLGTIIMVIMGAGAVILIAALVFGVDIVSLLFPSRAAAFSPYFVYGLLIVPPLLLVAVHNALYRAMGAPGGFMRIQIALFVSTVASGLFFLVVLGEGLIGAVKGLFWGGWLCVPLMLWDLRGKISLRPALQTVREVLAFSLPFVPHVVFVLIMGGADRVLIGRYLDIGTLGVYAVAANFGLLVGLVVSSYVASLGPFMLRLYHDNGDRAGAEAVAPHITRGFATVLLAWLGVSYFCREAIALMFPAAYQAAADIVPLFAVAFVARFLWLPYSYGFQYAKLTRAIPVISFLGMATTIIVDILTIPVIGMYGGALGFIAGFLVMAVAGGTWLRRRVLVTHQWRVMALLGLAAGALVGLAYLPPSLDWTVAVPLKLLGLGAFAALCALVGVLPVSGAVRRPLA